MGIIKNYQHKINEIHKEQKKLRSEIYSIENAIDKIAREIANEVIKKCGKRKSFEIIESLKSDSVYLLEEQKVAVFSYCPNENDHPNDRRFYRYSIPFDVFDLENRKLWIEKESKRLKK